MLIIDPYLFSRDCINGETEAQHAERLLRQLTFVEFICQRMQWRVVVEKNLWREIEVRLIRKLPYQAGDPRLRTAVTKFRQNLDMKVSGTKISGVAWGVKSLFHGIKSSDDEMYSRFVVESAAIARTVSSDVYIFVEQRLGRNVFKTGTGESWLYEKTHWRLYASISGSAPFVIPCVTCLRNIDVPWTARVDIDLPDVGTYRYKPVSNWESGRVDCIKTMESKKVWLDVDGNGWARPSTGGEPEHWDVYVKDNRLLKKVVLKQINITRFGVRSQDNTPGEVHHTPEKKRHIGRA
jgi:hypothetical protein